MTAPLLNYTTRVPAVRTASEISALLVEAGASAVGTTHDTGRTTGLAFTITTAHGPRSYRLPIDAVRVERVLQGSTREGRYLTPEHAERVAWRIVKDWIEAQLALLRTEMATLDQVMLPFMVLADGRTVFDSYAAQALELTP